ncbi:MAG: hypothetical protein RL226_1093 [Bacteroidota bacterium]|jgi:uncharacterized protein YecE (DUF72 family)
MKFGKLDHPLGVDFRLPTDHPDTRSVLSLPSVTPRVYCGGTMWNIPAWKGKIYPNKAKSEDFISFYAQQFGTIELNATHYKIHPPEILRRWADATPDDFVFCAKFPQMISHYRRFRNCEGLTDEFLEALTALGEKRGPTFIQLPPNFSPAHATPLLEYLERWPRDVRLAVEFRHPDWFNAHPEAEQVWLAMQQWGIGAVISDTAGRRDAVHMRITAPFLLLRFGGYSLHETDELRLSEWMDRIKQWSAGGMDEVHFLVHQPDSVLTPETCTLIATLAKKRGFNSVKSPSYIQTSLF